MKPLFDLHTHTAASGHAFGTLKENIEEAAKKGLLAMGTSDHSKNMPGTCGPLFFGNYKVIRDEIFGVRIYTGMEVNIIDYDGRLDMSSGMLGKMDYVIASLHVPCIKSGTPRENTDALIGAMKNPYVKIIGHPDDDRYPLEYDRLTAAAREMDIVLEINNSSLRPNASRQNASRNLKIMLEYARKLGIRVIMGSDAHIWYDVGCLDYSEKLLQELDYPEELILNYNIDRLKYVLN
ncbi:PHP domain-containing protein [Clostridium sp. MCC353]|uniref:phosphatase n=1 Tax=Clostridium sp. MCC353 TaxID=2592646 RepID=UPI001C00BCDE|nr:phosphatase [Clostridium sp. MCC353]MBT9777033.1 PHP domain-containing protein [Clostridium sp. MCC353]